MVDVCIIGSGAGASPVAYELSQAGFKVVVLEKGAWLKKEDFFKDEIAACRRSTYTPRLDQEQHVIEVAGEDATPTSVSGWDFWNGSLVGGSSNLMSGYFHRMKPQDFKLLSTYGAIKGANIVDWPIDYETLEPYYEKVERLVGVSGRVVAHTFGEPRSTKDFPYEPTIEHGITAWFDGACEKQGITPLPTPRAILPRAQGARMGCSYSGYCGSYGCATGAKGSAREALLEPALKSGNLEIIARAHVTHLDSDASSIRAAHYVDYEGNTHTIEAKIFVVACQAVETSRLLLNSKNGYFPQGMANSSGHVGKNMLFSAGGSGSGVFYYEDFSKESVAMLRQMGAFVNRSLQAWYELQDHSTTIKGGTVDFLWEHPNPVSKAKRLLNQELLWGDALKTKLLAHFKTKRTLLFEIFCDWLPTDGTHVTLDPSVKDRYGFAVARIHLDAHKEDLRAAKAIAPRCEALLKSMGAKDIATNLSYMPPQNLQAGGCRFGKDPATSVLDANCKAHDLDNLYVTDGSFMPTGGSVPYTWTIYANAFRVADSILERFKKG